MKLVFTLILIFLALWAPKSLAQTPERIYSDAILNVRDWGGFVTAEAGGFAPMSGTNQNLLFSYGGRAGMNLKQSGFATFAMDLSFNRETESVTLNGSSASQAFNEIMFQGIFRQAWKTGFYFGPQLGISIVNLSQTPANGDTLSGSSVVFEIGALAGYEINVGQNFSFGPEIQLVHIASSTISLTDSSETVNTTGFTNGVAALKFLMAASIYF